MDESKRKERKGTDKGNSFLFIIIHASTTKNIN
jgi:hypothetical protein